MIYLRGDWTPGVCLYLSRLLGKEFGTVPQNSREKIMMKVQTKKCQSGQHREQPFPCVRQQNKITEERITLSIQPRIQGQGRSEEHTSEL